MKNAGYLIVPTAIFLTLIFTSISLPQANDEDELRARNITEMLENQLSTTTDVNRQYSLLRHLPSTSLAAGDTVKAERNARALLLLAEELRVKNRFDGGSSAYAKHAGNIVLGIIEFDKGNLSRAREHLLAAGQLNGTVHPSLITFGPSMALAKKFTDIGEKKVVLQYLESCSKFWTNDQGRLDDWTAALNKGVKPVFGPNALYVLNEWRNRK